MSTPLIPGDELRLPAWTVWLFGQRGHLRVGGCTAEVDRIGPPMTTTGLAPLVVVRCREIPALPEWVLMANSREDLAAQLARARWMTARRVWESTRHAREVLQHLGYLLAVVVALLVIAWQCLAAHGIGPAEILLGGLVLAAVVLAVRTAVRRRGSR